MNGYKLIFATIVTCFTLALSGLLYASTASATMASPSCYVNVSTQDGLYTGVVNSNLHTSCPFAQNVTRASLRRIIQFGGTYNGPLTTMAYSPVTGLWYRVNCDAYGSIFADSLNVVCRAGIGAQVTYHAFRD